MDEAESRALLSKKIDSIRNFSEKCKQDITELLGSYGFVAEKLSTEGEDQEDGVGEDEVSEEHQTAEGEYEEEHDGEAGGEDEGEYEGEDEEEHYEGDGEEDGEEGGEENGEEDGEEDDEEDELGVVYEATYELIDGSVYEVTYEWIDAEDSEENGEEFEGEAEEEYEEDYEEEDDFEDQGEDEGDDQGQAMLAPVQPAALTFDLPIIGGRKRGREVDADEEEPSAKRVSR